MDLSVGGGGKLSRSTGLQSLVICHAELVSASNQCDSLGSAYSESRNDVKVARSRNSSAYRLTHPHFVAVVRFVKFGMTSKKAAFTLAEGATHVAQSAKPRRAAFTLAEVLITLGIIGVVAAMTLPALMQNYQKAQAVSQLKKSYAVVQNAIEMMRAENDGLDMLSMPFVVRKYDHPKCFDQKLFMDEFSKRVNSSEVGHRDSGNGDIMMCLPNDTNIRYKTAGGGSDHWQATVNNYITLNDGTCIGVSSHGNGWDWTDSVHIMIYIDVNGNKNPNQFGKDLFAFELKSDGRVLPYDGEESYGIGADCLASYSGWRARGTTCAKKIIDDGWQIKHDYKWQ